MGEPMAKAKRSTDDLDAELAALEAELAALEGKQAKPKKAAAPVPEPADEQVRGLGGLKFRKGFRLGGKGKSEPEPDAAAPPAGRAASAPPAEAPAAYDAALWRRDEDGAWVRTVSTTPRVVRRILDEEGKVVREEPADASALEEVPEARAERGVGKLLGKWTEHRRRGSGEERKTGGDKS